MSKEKSKTAAEERRIGGILFVCLEIGTGRVGATADPMTRQHSNSGVFSSE